MEASQTCVYLTIGNICLTLMRHRYYILDLLAWKGIHYWETEAEFRFFCALMLLDFF